jgi:hypothetical protein
MSNWDRGLVGTGEQDFTLSPQHLQLIQTRI